MVTTRSQTTRSSEVPQSPDFLCSNSQHGGQSSPLPLDDQLQLAAYETSAEAGNDIGEHMQMDPPSFSSPLPDYTDPEGCTCCVDHTQLFEQHNKMIEEHEGHMQQREVEIDGVYAHVKIERRKLEQLRDELLEQKAAYSKLIERSAAHFSAREAEMAQMHESLRGERAELRQHIMRNLQDRQAHSEMLQKHEMQANEAKRLLEHLRDLRKTREASAQQAECVREIFHVVWQFMDGKRNAADGVA